MAAVKPRPPLRQKEGIGNNFFTGFLKNLSKIPLVFLEVKKSSFPAINLYKKHDFKDLGIRNNYYKDGSSAMLMHYYQNL